MSTPDSSIMSISEEAKGDVLIIRLQGRLDALSSPAIQLRVLQDIANNHHKLLLNVAGVKYISSAGVMVLLSLNQKIKSVSGKLIVCAMDPNVHEIVKMTGFLRVLSVAKDEEEGLRNLCKN